MSRIGNRKLEIPAGVTVSVENGFITVKGPKGELNTKLADNIEVKVDGNSLEVSRSNDLYKPIHGTINALVNNMIIGVTKGFERQLEIVGVGYRFSQKGNVLVINAGYSHPIEMQVPEGLSIELPSNTELTIKGINKELLGEFAANVRKVRQPEPYKGKGIRYKDEHIIRKEGKKAA
jgi:large subunit ribosomal protein L6